MILAKLFGTKSDREIKKLSPSIIKINQCYESLSEKTDEDLVKRTQELKNFVVKSRKSKEDSLPNNYDKDKRKKEILVAEQNALDSIMEESFALVKETCRRMSGPLGKSQDKNKNGIWCPMMCSSLAPSLFTAGK